MRIYLFCFLRPYAGNQFLNRFRMLGSTKTKNVAAHRAMMRTLSQLIFFFMSLAFDYGTKIADSAVTQCAGNFRRLKKLFRMSFEKIPMGLYIVR